jgi:hypothetical protein
MRYEEATLVLSSAVDRAEPGLDFGSALETGGNRIAVGLPAVGIHLTPRGREPDRSGLGAFTLHRRSCPCMLVRPLSLSLVCPSFKITPLGCSFAPQDNDEGHRQASIGQPRVFIALGLLKYICTWRFLLPCLTCLLLFSHLLASSCSKTSFNTSKASGLQTNP